MGKQVFSLKKGNDVVDERVVVTADQAEFMNASVASSLVPNTTVVVPSQYVHSQVARKGSNGQPDTIGKYIYANVYDKDGKYMYTTGISVAAFQRTTYGTDPSVTVKLIQKKDAQNRDVWRAEIPAFDTNIDQRLRTEADAELRMLVPESRAFKIEKGALHFMTSMTQEKSKAWSTTEDSNNPGFAKLDRRYLPNIVSVSIPTECMDKNGKVQMPDECSGYML